MPRDVCEGKGCCRDSSGMVVKPICFSFVCFVVRWHFRGKVTRGRIGAEGCLVSAVCIPSVLIMSYIWEEDVKYVTDLAIRCKSECLILFVENLTFFKVILRPKYVDFRIPH